MHLTIVGSVEPPFIPPEFTILDAVEKRRPSPAPSIRQSSAAKKQSADNAERAGKPAIELVLYVSSISPHSTAALRNLRAALATFAGHTVKLTVCDLSKEPERAERDGVHFTPSLVTRCNGPKTWIVGHLGNPQVLQALLESALGREE